MVSENGGTGVKRGSKAGVSCHGKQDSGSVIWEVWMAGMLGGRQSQG